MSEERRHELPAFFFVHHRALVTEALTGSLSCFRASCALADVDPELAVEKSLSGLLPSFLYVKKQVFYKGQTVFLCFVYKKAQSS
jgi:hypothetical protein